MTKAMYELDRDVMGVMRNREGGESGLISEREMLSE